MSNLIIPLLALAFLIFVHELGHFMAAKLVKVKVEEFSIGFPPRLLSRVISGTKYSLGLLFLGGFVRLKGQNLDDENVNEAGNYAAQSKLARFFIIFSGPLINILLAFLLMPIAYKIGLPVYNYLTDEPVIIEEVMENSLASATGFQNLDEIIKVDDQPVKSWQEFYNSIQQKIKQPRIDITVIRNTNNNGASTVKLELDNLKSTQAAAQLGIIPRIPAMVGKLTPGFPADVAGFADGDKITAANGEKISSLKELREFLQQNKNNPANFSIIRNINGNAENLTIRTAARFDEKNMGWVLGFETPTKLKAYGWAESIKIGTNKLFDLLAGIGEFFKKLSQNDVSKDEIGGPVMIFKVIGDASNRGISYLIIMVAFISLQLGIFNLLPIPVLDGGHILFLGYELLAGKQPSIKARNIMQYVSFLFLIALMLIITIKDIINL